MKHSYLTTPIMLLSLILALGLEILPLPQMVVWYRPQALLLVIFYWILRGRMGLFSVWLSACCLDVLKGGLIGQHAFILTLLSYSIIKFQQRIVMFKALQQSIILTMLAFVYQLLILWVQNMINQLHFQPSYWFAPLVTGVLWLWLMLLSREKHAQIKHVR